MIRAKRAKTGQTHFSSENGTDAFFGLLERETLKMRLFPLRPTEADALITRDGRGWSQGECL